MAQCVTVGMVVSFAKNANWYVRHWQQGDCCTLGSGLGKELAVAFYAAKVGVKMPSQDSQPTSCLLFASLCRALVCYCNVEVGIPNVVG